MLLVIDVGNTETVLGVYEAEKLKTHWRLSSRLYGTSDECWIQIRMWCEAQGLSVSDIAGVAICSVVPSLTAVFREVSTGHLGIEPLVVTAETDTGLRILYDTPRTVGADRICNGVAGFARYGVIGLGVVSASQELHRLAAKLPRVDTVFPPCVVGKTTETSMQSGIMWGTVALVDGMIDRIVGEMQWERFRVIATGGAASLVVENLKKVKSVEPFLTLEGIRIIYQRFRQKRK